MSSEFNVDEDVKVQNIVGSGDLTREIKVDVFAEGLEEEFGYKHYNSREKAEDKESSNNGYSWISGGAQPGLYYEVGGKEGAQVTFHESGSYIVRADSKDELYETNDKVIEEVKQLGVIDQDVNDFNFEIQNVVALAKIGKDIRLRGLKMGLDDKDARYEPEVFPALEYSTDDSRYPCSFLVYGNGKVIIAGASSVEEVKESMQKFYDKIDEVYLSAAEY